MKNLLIILTFALLFSACKKDKIYPRDRKDDCKDCVIEYNNGNSTITYDDYMSSGVANMTWCELLDIYESRGYTDLAGNPIDGVLRCR